MTTPAAKALLSHLRNKQPDGCDLDALAATGIKPLKSTLGTCTKAGLVEDRDGIYHLTEAGAKEIYTAPPPPPATSLRFAPSEIVQRSVVALVPDARNARTHNEDQVAALAGVIRTYGWTAPVLIGPDDGIIAGHGRVLAARKLGLTQVPCIVLPHLTADERRAYLLADNRMAELAGWDDAMLKAELMALDKQGLDVTSIGWSDDDVAALEKLTATAAAEPKDLDAIPVVDERKPAKSKRGEVYQLGPHRLMCGDSTSAEDVALLFDGRARDLVLTDPPYCSGGFQEAGKAAGSIGSIQIEKGGRFEGGIANDKLSSRGYQAMMRRVLELWSAPAAYVFTDWRMWVQLFDLMESCGYGIRNMIVWDKGTPGMGRGWRTQHELVAFGASATVPFDNHKAVGNVVKSARTGNKLHPTQKPVDVIETILGVTDFAKVIADPFAGSGTTLMACAAQGRTFYGMELMPHFCDVIRRRWTAYANEQGLEPGTGALED